MQNINFKRSILLSVLFLLLSACSNYSNTNKQYSDTSPELTNTTRGRELFSQRCIGCHGISGDAQQIGAANLQLTRLDSLGIVTTIKNGRNKMPPFGNSFADSDMAQLEQYVMTLRKRN